MAALSREIAPLVGADPDEAEAAARFAKADLSSEMVYEFPDLQGLMGRYYAAEAGLSDAVALAAQEHYSPLGPSDDVPSAPVSVAVALAEKIDKLTGFWAIDEKPTGSKDPFALRRAALGVIRLVLENAINLPLLQFLSAIPNPSKPRMELIEGIEIEKAAVIEAEARSKQVKPRGLLDSFETQEEAAERAILLRSNVTTLQGILHKMDAMWEEMPTALLSFFHDRLKVYLKDEGISHDVIDASLAMPGNDDLLLLVNRAKALAAFLKTDDGVNLIQGFKRANNILSQAEDKDGVEYSFGAEVKFADTDEEKALFTALDAADAKIAPAMAAEDFGAAMSAMADLRAPIDAFFNTVQINADSALLRRNRLNLLHRIRTICLSVADLRKLEG
jgi:glycyl-tRNA synthetase beta chain